MDLNFIFNLKHLPRYLLASTLLTTPLCTMAVESKELNNRKIVTKERTITGKITSKSDGSVMPGVNVVIKGTQIGTTTNSSGSYSFEVDDSKSPVLVFSYIGYITQEIVVGNQSSINVVLEESVENLREAVVTALGIKREERSLGYSIAKVDGKEFNRVAQENVLNAMSGKVAGVTINQTGGTGSSVSMVIRGATSLSSDNQPLFVIDGVPIANTLNNVTQIGNGNMVDYGNAISGLNPEDIANVTVLKGPSAAALYGSRAGNGVVLITTKSGKSVDKMTVSITSNTVFDRPTRFLKWQSYMGPGQFSSNPELAAAIPSLPIINEAQPYGFGGMLDKGYTAVQWNSPVGADGKKIATPLVSHPNNVRDFVQTGITTTNGISVANSSQNYDYRISYANMTNKGIVPNSDLFRNTLNINSSIKVSSKVRLSTNVDLSRNNSNNRPATERGANPMQWAYNVSPHVDINELRDYWMPGQEGLQQKYGSYNAANNPWFLAYEVNNGFVRDRIYGNVRADWDITKELSFMVRSALDTYNEQRETKIANSYSDDKYGVYGLPPTKSLESNVDFLLTYKKGMGAIDLSASVGGNTRYQTGNSSYIGSKSQGGLIVPGVFTVQNILPANLDYSNSRYERKVNSLYAMATLGYKDMVYLDVSGRNDWSSTLPGADPYFYPSASLSLLVNEMFRLPSDINMIKVRGGYAQVGNDAGPYQLQQVLGNAGAWGSVPRLTTSGGMLNPNLKPEKASSYEAGVDVTLFKNRLNFTATGYVVDNENQIFNTAMASSTGYTSKNINAGLLRSRGIELTLGGTPVQTADFRWDVSMNWTRNRTKVIKLADEMPYFLFWEDAKGGAWTYKGEDVGDIYGPEIRVVEDKDSPYYGYPWLERDASYGWAFYKVATAGQASKNKIGNFNPKFIMGFQNTITYKNFRLSFTIDWRNGGNFVSQTYRYGMSNGQTQLALDRLRDPGDRTGKELRDWLVANEDEYIKVSGNNFPQFGWPTQDRTSYPMFFGAVLPYGGIIVPGVYQATNSAGVPQFDDAGKPIFVENLGETINPNTIRRALSGTQPVPYAAANPWDFIQPSLFDASFVKLREVSLSYTLPAKISKKLKLQDASVGLYSRNILLWTKAKVNIDPERAFQATTGTQGGIQFKQGIERYNVDPLVVPVGVKLNLTF